MTWQTKRGLSLLLLLISLIILFAVINSFAQERDNLGLMRRYMAWQQQNSQRIADQEAQAQMQLVIAAKREWYSERWDKAHNLLAKQLQLIYQIRAEYELWDNYNLVALDNRKLIDKLLEDVENEAKKQRKLAKRKF